MAWQGGWLGRWAGSWFGPLEAEQQPPAHSDGSGLPLDRRRKKREERIAREMLARQQHAEASAIARAGGVALHRPWRPEEQAEKDARQQAMRAQQMAEAAAQEAIEKARQAAEKARSQRIRLLVCAALVMDN